MPKSATAGAVLLRGRDPKEREIRHGLGRVR